MTFSPVEAQLHGTVELFHPKSGPVGTLVDVRTREISSVLQVLFNGLPAEFKFDPVNGLITATVPPGAVTGRIAIVSPTGVVVTTESFFVAEELPSIRSFTPQGPVGMNVIVELSSSVPVSKVLFNGVTAGFGSLFDRFIIATVPGGSASGPITVEFDGGRAETEVPFIVTPGLPSKAPRITSFFPAEAHAGVQVLVRGEHLGEPVMDVRIGGIIATYAVVPDGLLLTVPNGVRPGRISVVTLWGLAFSDSAFEVVPPPRIDGFEPREGTPGSIVAIIGQGLASVTKVFLGDVAADFEIHPDGTTIDMTVPPGVEGGKIRVEAAGGSVEAEKSFTVSRIVGFTPMATVGSDVVLLINTERSVFDVQFNGVRAMFSRFRSPVGLLILARVPAGATSGHLSVGFESGRAVSGEVFVVVPEPVPNGLPQITGFIPEAAVVGSRVMVEVGPFADEILAVLVDGRVASYRRVDRGVEVTIPAGAVKGPVSVVTYQGVITSRQPFIVDAYSVRRGLKIPFEWDPNDDEKTEGYRLYVFDAFGRQVHREKFPGRSTGSAIVSLDLSGVPIPNGEFTAAVTAYDGAGIESRFSERVRLRVLPSLDSISATSGILGDIITISGTGLTGVSGVHFAGVPAAFEVVATGQIQARVPPKAASGRLEVIVGGEKLLALSDFQILSNYDLELQGPEGPLSVAPGVEFRQRWRMINRGPTDAADVRFGLDVPLGVHFKSMMIDGQVTEPGEGVQEWFFDWVSMGEVIELQGTFVTSAIGARTVVARVNTAKPDLEFGNNLAPLTMVAFPPLKVRQVADSRMEISWTGGEGEFVLQGSASGLSGKTSWNTIALWPEYSDGQSRVPVEVSGEHQFFRLKAAGPEDFDDFFVPPDF